MKGIAITVVLLSGFYVFMLNAVGSELKDLANFYDNMDQYTTQALNSKSPINPLPQTKLKTFIDSYTNIF